MKNKLKILIVILLEYRLSWCFCRFIYILKIKLMQKIKKMWKFFEKRVNVKDIDVFDIDNKLLEEFLNSMNKEEKLSIIKKANDAIDGKIEAFNSIKLNYGKPIRWNFNPITNQTISLEKYWFEIEDFNKQLGDIKVIWEPSRFCYFYLFSRAYIITKDIKYYEAFSNHIKLWIKNNTYPFRTKL